ncbi:divergent polysaccharide deacetylase family protein [Colwellia sp. D2M02]|uniref:divergent polysaccharide deacetylase family protein n=1 Tax=Colwellia sp. D2M02 TaxID=2841562 RepID=UPI00339D8D85
MIKKFLIALSISLTIYCPFLSAETVKVAIVIDDMGYRYTDEKALSLPGNVTYAMLPHTTYGKKLAIKANEQKNDVIIHIPMEANNRKYLGPGAITSAMNEQAVHKSLTESFNDIPFAIGINNHMGSYLTKLYKPMTWTMSFLKERDLLFLDSKTSPSSQAVKAAVDIGVPVNSRHVFLDNELTDEYITKQFQHLIRYAKKQKFAIAIAHPHPETVSALTKLIPTLKQNNIELVPLSSLYPAKNLTGSELVASD